MKSLMHDSNLNRIPLLGATVRRRLVQRVAEMRVATKGTSDPDVSIVIRSKNNAQQLQGLMEDIQAQVFEGGIEIIVVDTESTDGSAAIAQAFGARVVTITQANFSYPKSLNAGFEVATKSWVYTCVDHSALASRYLLKTITRWDRDPHVAGIWAFTLPNANASVWERLAYVVWMRRMLRMAHMARKDETGMGFMGGNNMAVRRSVWQAVGGFDERYAAGAEDWALGMSMVKAGYRAAYDPGLAVYHTHGLGLVGCWRQLRYWRRIMRPTPFSVTELRRYRSDL